MLRFPHECISLEFNFTDFAFVTLFQYTAKMFVWYLISRKRFICEIREINPKQNLRLLQYVIQLLHLWEHVTKIPELCKYVVQLP